MRTITVRSKQVSLKQIKALEAMGFVVTIIIQ